jgi:hypothetical protein
LSKKLMLLVALSLAFAAMFMFAGPASAQTTVLDGVDGTPPCPAGTVQIDGRCVFTTTVTPTTAVPVETFGPSQEFSIRRISSGAANPTTRISNTGDNVNLSAPVQQTVNTGNVVNEQGVVTGPGTGFNNECVDAFGNLVSCGFNDGFIGNNDVCVDVFGNLVSCGFNDGFIGGFDGFNTDGDINLEGSSINLSPALTSDTTQTINQAAAA